MKIAEVEAKLDAWGIEVDMIRAPIVALVERVVQAEDALALVSFELARSVLKHLTDEQRIALLDGYCRHCGSNDPSCQCWNDE